MNSILSIILFVTVIDFTLLYTFRIMHYTLNIFCLYCMLHSLYYVFLCNIYIYYKFLLDLILDILFMLYFVFLFCTLDEILLIIIYMMLWIWLVMSVVLYACLHQECSGPLDRTFGRLHLCSSPISICRVLCFRPTLKRLRLRLLGDVLAAWLQSRSMWRFPLCASTALTSLRWFKFRLRMLDKSEWWVFILGKMCLVQRLLFEPVPTSLC